MASTRLKRSSFRKQLRRRQVLEFFKALPACLVGMEACATAHYWARELTKLGHRVRLMPAKDVKAYVKRNKNDAADAEAICEAARRPTVRFVQIKSTEQQGRLMLHRARDLLMRQRTQVINAMRAHLAELGIVAAQGRDGIKELLKIIASEADARLPVDAHTSLVVLAAELRHRKLLQSKAIAIENDLRGTLRNFGLKVGMAGTVKFETRIKELVGNSPELAALVEPLLVVRRVLREQLVILHRRLLAIVRDDEVCQRLMTTPGVGPVVALTYRATVDVPARFRKSKSVGAVFGLTCSKYQSGEIDRSGRISRCGDEMMRVMLYEAAQSMLYSKKWSWLKAWAMQIARRRGMKKAIGRWRVGWP